MNQTKEFSWWIRILTDNPMYIYYFGGFNNYWEAELSKNGYVQDLKEEKAEIVDIAIGKYEPKEMTISAVIQPK
ncbi:MAG: DUF1816 domain-containing protein [Crocosphaera sp.]